MILQRAAFLILLTTIGIHSALGQGESLFPDEASKQKVTLVPTEDLNPFSIYSWKKRKWTPNKDRNHVFRLQNRMLRAGGKDILYLTTKRTFRNYQLIAEYKWLNHKTPRDSGIFVNATPIGSAIMAFECNITAAPSKAPMFGLWGIGPSRQLMVDGKKISSIPRPGGADIEKPVGEWNRVEIICDRDRFYFSVNGRKIASGTHPVPRSGSIMFQHNRGDILFGRVEIVDYDALSLKDAEKARRWQNDVFSD